MTEEENSVTDEQFANVQEEGVSAEVAEQPESETPTAKEINFRRLEEARDSERDGRVKAEQELAVMRDRMNRVEQANKGPAKPEREKDDLLSYGDYDQDMTAREQKYHDRMVKLEAKVNAPDLDAVINKYGKQLNQAVAQACMRADNPYLAAYEACKSSEAYYKDQLSGQHHEYAKKAESNAKKPRNPAMVGGKGSLGNGKDYAKMSNAELLRMGDRFRQG
jgi:hypothetical protein